MSVLLAHVERYRPSKLGLVLFVARWSRPCPPNEDQAAARSLL